MRMPRIRLPLAQNPTTPDAQNPTTPCPESDYPLPRIRLPLTPNKRDADIPRTGGGYNRLKPPVGDQVFALEDVTRANMATIALEGPSVAETATSA